MNVPFYRPVLHTPAPITPYLPTHYTCWNNYYHDYSPCHLLPYFTLHRVSTLSCLNSHKTVPHFHTAPCTPVATLPPHTFVYHTAFYCLHTQLHLFYTFWLEASPCHTCAAATCLQFCPHHITCTHTHTQDRLSNLISCLFFRTCLRQQALPAPPAHTPFYLVPVPCLLFVLPPWEDFGTGSYLPPVHLLPPPPITCLPASALHLGRELPFWTATCLCIFIVCLPFRAITYTHVERPHLYTTTTCFAACRLPGSPPPYLLVSHLLLWCAPPPPVHYRGFGP